MKNNSNNSNQSVLREELLCFIPEKAGAFSLMKIIHFEILCLHQCVKVHTGLQVLERTW